MKAPVKINMSKLFTDMKAEYAAAQPSRFRRTRRLLGGGADSHYLSPRDFNQLREYARDMDRNDWVIGQLVDRAVTNIVQQGFTVDAKTPNPQLNVELNKRFRQWAADPTVCSADRQLSFWQMEQLVLRSMFVDGDIFVNPLNDARLQLIESHRATTPTNSRMLNVIHGIEIDLETRRRKKYWFTKSQRPHIRTEKVGDMQKFQAEDADGNPNIFHVYDPSRASQTRGITAFHAVMDLAGMTEDLNFSNLIRSQFAACVVWFLERLEETHGDLQMGSREEIELQDGSSQTLEGISPGQFIRGLPGEKLRGMAPDVPNPEFQAHMKFLLTAIGVNLGMPLIMVLLDASESNFSGWRGAMDQARIGFRRNQRLLIERFHSPVYRFLVRHWASQDSALAAFASEFGDEMFAHSFNPPGWPYVQPLQDAQADAVSLTNMLTSPRRRSAQRGIDYEDMVKEILQDNSTAIQGAIERAKAIQIETGVEVTWREVLNWIPMKGLKLEPGSIDGSETL